MTDTLSIRDTIDNLWNYADPAVSEQRFRNFLQSPNLRDADQAEVWTQLSRACCLQRHHDAAQQALDEAERRLPPGPSRARARFLLESGRLANEMGRNRNGVPLFEEAMRVAGECGEDFFALDAIHMLGFVIRGREGVTWHEKGIQAADRTSDPRAAKWLYRLHANLGAVLEEIGDFAGAHRCYENALQQCRIHQYPVSRVHDIRCNIARTIRRSGDPAQALTLQTELLRDIAGLETDLHGYANEEIGECLIALDRALEAKPHFRIAYDRLKSEPWFSPTQKDRLERMRRLADGQIENKKTDAEGWK